MLVSLKMAPAGPNVLGKNMAPFWIHSIQMSNDSWRFEQITNKISRSEVSVLFNHTHTHTHTHTHIYIYILYIYIYIYIYKLLLSDYFLHLYVLLNEICGKHSLIAMRVGLVCWFDDVIFNKIYLYIRKQELFLSGYACLWQKWNCTFVESI